MPSGVQSSLPIGKESLLGAPIPATDLKVPPPSPNSSHKDAPQLAGWTDCYSLFV